MKKMNLILGIAALAMAGGTVGAVASVASEAAAIQTSAASANVLYLKVNDNWASANAWFSIWGFDGGTDTMYKMEKVSGRNTVYSASISSEHKKVIFVRKDPANTSVDWSGMWSQTGNLDLVSGKNLFKIDGWGDGTWGNCFKATGTIDAFSDGNGNSLESSSFTSYALDDETFYPGIHTCGYQTHWYSDEEKTSEFAPSVLKGDINLWGEYTKLEYDDYFYVTQSSHNSVDWKAYSFNSNGDLDEHLGTWGGTVLDDDLNPSENVLKFGGSDFSVFKVPFASKTRDNKIHLNNGLSGTSEKKSSELPLISKSLVYWDGNTGGACDSNKGKIVDFVLHLKSALDAAENNSVCKVAKDVASGLVEEYDALLKLSLNDDQAAFLSNSAIMTYTGQDIAGSKAWISVEPIVEQLRANASAGTNPLNAIRNNSAQQTTGFVVAGVSVVGLIAVGGLFLLRKKKEI